MRRATGNGLAVVDVLPISIHALLAESDVAAHGKHGAPRKFLSTLSLRRATLTLPCVDKPRDISIHALLAESDPVCAAQFSLPPRFLSTLSLRRATDALPEYVRFPVHFYPRSPCGERHRFGGWLIPHDNFYPRSPCGERPGRCRCWVLSDIISIHALLAESDQVLFRQSA